MEVTIRVTKEVFERLMEDKKHFEKVIGGKWSISDVITEYLKIINQYKK